MKKRRIGDIQDWKKICEVLRNDSKEESILGALESLDKTIRSSKSVSYDICSSLSNFELLVSFLYGRNKFISYKVCLILHSLILVLLLMGDFQMVNQVLEKVHGLYLSQCSMCSVLDLFGKKNEIKENGEIHVLKVFQETIRTTIDNSKDNDTHARKISKSVLKTVNYVLQTHDPSNTRNGHVLEKKSDIVLHQFLKVFVSFVLLIEHLDVKDVDVWKEKNLKSLLEILSFVVIKKATTSKALCFRALKVFYHLLVSKFIPFKVEVVYYFMKIVRNETDLFKFVAEDKIVEEEEVFIEMKSDRMIQKMLLMDALVSFNIVLNYTRESKEVVTKETSGFFKLLDGCVAFFQSSKDFFKLVFDLFSCDDDFLVRSLSELLEIYVKLKDFHFKQWKIHFKKESIHPQVVFRRFLDFIDFNVGTVIHFLISNETTFLEYFLKFLKIRKYSMSGGVVNIIDKKQHVFFNDLKSKLKTLYSKKMISYNVNPLVKLM